jgi:hypothetical protein
MKKIFVTTFNKKLFDKYAYKLIDTYLATKQKIPLYCYVEDDVNLYPKVKNIIFINLYESQPESKKFVERNLIKNQKNAKLFLLDVVRFSYKVFAQSDARKYGDYIFFIDADTYFIKTIPEEWFDKCLPKQIFISFYERLGFYTEAGFLGFNNKILTNKGVKLIDLFFEVYLSYYTKDLIYSLPAFTDCHALDATRYRFIFLKPYIQEYKFYNEKKLGDNLLYLMKNETDIMGNDKFTSEYFIHCKGAKKFN